MVGGEDCETIIGVDKQTEKEAAKSIDARCRSLPEQAAALIPGVAADVNPGENQEDQQDP